MAREYTDLAEIISTALESLADGAYWVSPNFNGAALAAHEIDFIFNIITTTTLGTDGDVQVFYVGSLDGGTVYEAGIDNTDSDSTYTPVGDDVDELNHLGTLTYTAETTARELNDMFNLDNIPQDFKLVILNNTGAALGTGNSVKGTKSVY